MAIQNIANSPTIMAAKRFVVCGSAIFDSGIKNKFKWKWLTEKDFNGDFYSDYVRKLEDNGKAWCCYCNRVMNYGGSGKSSFKTREDRRPQDETDDR